MIINYVEQLIIKRGPQNISMMGNSRKHSRPQHTLELIHGANNGRYWALSKIVTVTLTVTVTSAQSGTEAAGKELINEMKRGKKKKQLYELADG